MPTKLICAGCGGREDCYQCGAGVGTAVVPEDWPHGKIPQKEVPQKKGKCSCPMVGIWGHSRRCTAR